MRIACVIYSDYPDGSGPPRRLHLISKGFVDLGHTVHVVVPQRFRPGPVNQDIDGVHVHWGSVTTATTWNKLPARLAARRAAFQLVRRLAMDGLDWLLLSNPSLDGLPLLLVARRYGVRVAATYDDLRARSSRPTLEDRVRLAWLETADALIPRLTQLNLATSELLINRVRSIAAQTPTFLLPPLVDLDLFQPDVMRAEAFRAKWKIGGLTVISYLGTFWKVEGVSNLLKAAKTLRHEGLQFKLVISGASHQGLDCDNVAVLVRELDLADIVVETGWLPTEEVVAGMSAADILVVPKLNDAANMAGMPAKLAEYLAIGRAVVASRVGDIPLYLRDRDNAALCGPGDVDSLTNALRELINDNSFRSRLAANARDAADEHFNYRRIVSRLESSLRQMHDEKSS